LIEQMAPTRVVDGGEYLVHDRGLYVSKYSHVKGRSAPASWSIDQPSVAGGSS
jgi:hypothetical protein